MPYKAPGFTLIYAKYDEIYARGAVSEVDYEILGGRLEIACSTTPEKKGSNYRSQHQRKVARKIYCLVYEEDPNIFMAFILSVSPRACESFKFSDFVAQHKTRPKILFNDSALFSIWNVAHKHGLATTKRLVQFIQWHTQTPPPVTGADGMGHQYWSLRLSSFAAIQNLFGDIIVDAVRRFPPEAGMYMSDCLPESTTNIWTRIPHQELQDSVICLNIGHALAVADVLFPIGSKKVGSIITANESYDGTPAAASLPNSMETALGPGSPNILQESSLFDDAYFTLRGAHVEALSSIFGTEICRGIGESQLREWEIKQLLVDTTDCVTMQLRREQPHLGILRLRVGFYTGSYLANILYQESP